MTRPTPEQADEWARNEINATLVEDIPKVIANWIDFRDRAHESHPWMGDAALMAMWGKLTTDALGARTLGNLLTALVWERTR